MARPGAFFGSLALVVGFCGAAKADLAADIERTALREPKRTMAVARAALAAANSTGDKRGELRALRQLLRVRTEIDDLEGDAQLIACALQLADDLADIDARAELLLARAIVLDAHRQVGQVDAAHAEAEEFAARAGQRFHLMRVPIQRALWKVGNGRHTEAVARLASAQSLAGRDGDAYIRSRVLASVADTLLYATSPLRGDST